MKKALAVMLCAFMLVGILPFGIFATDAKDTVYTMWGNNIKQCAIHENGTVLGDDGFYVNDVKPTKRYKDFYKVIQDNMPSIIALQECDLGWHDLLENIDGVGNAEGVSPISTLGYQLVIAKSSVSIENSIFDDCRRGVRNPIYFDTAVFKLVDADVVVYSDPSKPFYENPWTYTWAVLEDKSNGNRIGVTSTHVPAGDSFANLREDYARKLSEKIEWIESTYNVPVISMGDYNAVISEASCQVHYAKMDLAREVAKETENLEYKTAGNALGARPGLSDENTTSIIDHCFISRNGIASEKYEVRIDDNTYSDHVPHLLTFRILGTAHEHTYDEYAQYDEETHKSQCSECYKVIDEAHSFGEAYLPSEGSESTHEKICVDCGYKDKSEHVITSGEKVDNDTHRGKCEICGSVGIGTHVYSWTEKDADTCTGTCSCGASTTRTHVYDYSSNGNGKNDTHTGRCSCGNVCDEAHAWDSGKATIKATYESSGMALFTCELCGASREEKVEAFDIPDSPFELGEGGQLHFYAGQEKTPTVDGNITEGEYSLEIKNLAAINDDSDDRFFTTLQQDKIYDLDSVNVYVSYDSENIYVGVEVLGDKTRSSYGDTIQLFIGTTEKTDELSMFQIPRIPDGKVKAYPFGVDVPSSKVAESEAKFYVVANKTVDDWENITYEIALKRDMLGIDDLDTIFFGILVKTADKNNSAVGNVYFGFDTKGIENIFPYSSRGDFYMHLLTIGEEPVVGTEPVTEEPSATKGGCGASVTTLSVALVMAFALCGAFILNKKETK